MKTKAVTNIVCTAIAAAAIYFASTKWAIVLSAAAALLYVQQIFDEFRDKIELYIDRIGRPKAYGDRDVPAEILDVLLDISRKLEAIDINISDIESKAKHLPEKIDNIFTEKGPLIRHMEEIKLRLDAIDQTAVRATDWLQSISSLIQRPARTSRDQP